MNLPNYYLADTPSGALPTPEIVEECCRSLRRNRERHLKNFSTEQIIALLCDVAGDWQQPDFKYRKLALEYGPTSTGFSSATIARGLDGLFRQFTPENFCALLTQEFGDAERLEEKFVSDAINKRSAIIAPELLAHIAAGNLPNPMLMSITLGLLLRSAQFVKCGSGTSLLPRLFAHSLHEAYPHLGVCLEIAEWPGGSAGLDGVLFAEADYVTATGSDETLAAVRARLQISKRFVGYGHRISFGFVSSDVLSGPGVSKIISAIADDVTAWDQQGCLSPHVIYVEDVGLISAAKLAGLLAEELAYREKSEPRGELSVEESAAIVSRREIYGLRAAHDSEATKLWASEGSTAWTVVFESEPRFQTSCLNRFIYVKPVRDLEDALNNADAVRGKVSTVGLAANEAKAPGLATALARWGVTRICPLGQMQNPPLAWRHDGRPPLGELVTWMDFEL